MVPDIRHLASGWRAKRNAATLMMVAFALAACASTAGGSQTSTATLARTASSTRLVACHIATSADAETANWVTYVNPTFGYCLRHPPGWYLYPSPDDGQSFSSENAGPMGLTPSAIWFYVLITNASQSDCARTNTRDFTDGAASGARYIVSPTATTIDGTSGVRFDGVALVVVNVWRGRCYDFFCVIGTPAGNRHVMDLILGSFRFGP
jgi:hypothetical protein